MTHDAQTKQRDRAREPTCSSCGSYARVLPDGSCAYCDDEEAFDRQAAWRNS